LRPMGPVAVSFVLGASLLGTSTSALPVDTALQASVNLTSASARDPSAGGAGGIEHGQASWYHCPTEGSFAAQHQILRGTTVTITNLDNGRKVTVIIDDRGPYGIPGRIIDLCSSAFTRIAPLGQGVADVEISW
jgi:rare lipoprotein A (peptidoglycan hydrolase)